MNSKCIENRYWKVYVPGEKLTYPKKEKSLIQIVIGYKDSKEVRTENFMLVTFEGGEFYTFGTHNLVRFNSFAFWRYMNIPDGIETQTKLICNKDGYCKLENEGYCIDDRQEYVFHCMYRQLVKEYKAVNFRKD